MICVFAGGERRIERPESGSGGLDMGADVGSEDVIDGFCCCGVVQLDVIIASKRVSAARAVWGMECKDEAAVRVAKREGFWWVYAWKRSFDADAAAAAEAEVDEDDCDDCCDEGPWKILARVRKMCLFGGWMGR